MPQIAKTDLEIENCFEVMSELRPHIVRENFVQTIREMERQGYQLAYIKDEGLVVAVAGYRIFTNLLMGKNLYIDDLVTSSVSRSKGFGETMVKWLRDLAKNADCKFYRLDSGTQRGEAHRFYFRQGFTILAYHFAENLSNS
jgi:GNAT superfamily N-acetyltransferase